jgi:hypothetical protein
VLLALSVAGWILSRYATPPQRRLGSHVVACSVTTAVLPHIMKLFIDQERPDRLTIKGHLRGIPFSGKSEDAFPSGMLSMLARLHLPQRCYHQYIETRSGRPAPCW